MKIQFWDEIICDKIQYCGNNIYLCNKRISLLAQR
nr:MAG TPA: hypothetical protein [Caudoviricetes sp.]